jgi:hypothetical protein
LFLGWNYQLSCSDEPTLFREADKVRTGSKRNGQQLSGTEIGSKGEEKQRVSDFEDGLQGSKRKTDPAVDQVEVRFRVRVRVRVMVTYIYF